MIQYDPTGKKYTLDKIEAVTGTYELEIWASPAIGFINIGLNLNGIRQTTAEMNCQEGMVTSELWDSFVNNLIKELAKVNITVIEKDLMEKLWDLMVQIRLTVVDDHLAPVVPDYNL